jgi:hypothetical protein
MIAGRQATDVERFAETGSTARCKEAIRKNLLQLLAVSGFPRTGRQAVLLCKLGLKSLKPS